MTNRNDDRNWLVMAGKEGETPIIVCTDQAENKAKAAAENYAHKYPGTAVSLYQRVGVVAATVTTKWE